jgi:hypothetical protein
MGSHDDYGKRLLRTVAGDAFVRSGPSVYIDYGSGDPAKIDGTVGGQVAVEVDSRTGKQVRGAVLDLVCHPYPKKLLVLIPAYMSGYVAGQCGHILARFLDPKDFRVVLLAGTGESPDQAADTERVRGALRELGFEAGL